MKIPKFEDLKALREARPKFDELCYKRVFENCIEKICKEMIECPEERSHYYISVDLFGDIISRKQTGPDGEISYREYNDACWNERKKWAQEHNIKRMCYSVGDSSYITDDNNPVDIGLGIQVDDLMNKEEFTFDDLLKFADREYMTLPSWFDTLIKDVEKELKSSGWKLTKYECDLHDKEELDEANWEEIEITQENCNLMVCVNFIIDKF